MNGWFLAAGALLAAAFSVHLFSGNRLYSAARPDAATAPPRACEAWMMGRCGMQMISVDLLLAAGILVLYALGVLPRSFRVELFMQLLIGGCFLLGVGTMGGGALGRVTLGGVLLLGYMIVLSAAAFTIWTALLGKFPVGKVSLFGFLIPVFGTLFSALVLGENIFTARNLAALVLVSGGIAVANSASTKK